MSAFHPKTPDAFDLFKEVQPRPEPRRSKLVADQASYELPVADFYPMRVYVAGPMSGFDQYNAPAFREAADTLREMGFDVLSPVELDEEDGLDPASLGDGTFSVEDYKDVLSRDIAEIVRQKVEAIVVLPGWEASGGANTEVAFGRAIGLPVLRYPDLEEVTNLQQVAASAEAQRKNGEVRITDPDTGGQKGQKDARHELIPPLFLDELAQVYGFGASKYDDYNYLLGYDWNLSIGAMLRHINAWRMGETFDEESGLDHRAHAAWHLASLMMFEQHELGNDNRMDTWLEGDA